MSSSDQKTDLVRQVAQVTASATAQQIPVTEVVTEVGSASNGYRRKFLVLPRDRSAHRIVVEHRDRFSRFSSEHLQARWPREGPELVVVDSAEVDDDLVRNTTEILTSCGRGGAENAALPTAPGARVDASAGADFEAP